ncbi:hypothetical protein BSKO_00912 [Bryopsis sp. KO-2023]|nr:hypothetical protein BSKO_00912 [Bryopsis sp. KO-2023]
MGGGLGWPGRPGLVEENASHPSENVSKHHCIDEAIMMKVLFVSLVAALCLVVVTGNASYYVVEEPTYYYYDSVYAQPSSGLVKLPDAPPAPAPSPPPPAEAEEEEEEEEEEEVSDSPVITGGIGTGFFRQFFPRAAPALARGSEIGSQAVQSEAFATIAQGAVDAALGAITG